MAVALLSSPLPSWWGTVRRPFSGLAFSRSNRYDKSHQRSPRGRLEQSRAALGDLGGAQRLFSSITAVLARDGDR